MINFKFKNKNWGVLGLGRSGVAAANLLISAGAGVFCSESRKADSLPELKKLSKKAGIETGGHTGRILDSGAVVISPGIPKNTPVVMSLKKRGVPLISEVELAYDFFRGARIAGITGTNGKTTTTLWTSHILEACGVESIPCGNVGRPASEAVLQAGSKSFLVIELSSFQLEDIVSFRADFSSILNLAPDHLERYESSMNNYKKAKYRIFENARPGSFLAVNYDDGILKRDFRKKRFSGIKKIFLSLLGRPPVAAGASVYLEKGLITASCQGFPDFRFEAAKLQPAGEHNIANAMFALIPAWLSGLEHKRIAGGLRSFLPPEHRLEKIKRKGNIFINDSKATNVDSTLVALKSFNEGLILIMGGRDKGSPYTPLYDEIRKKVSLILLSGEAAQKIKNDLRGSTEIVSHKTLDENLNYLKKVIRPGMTVLFSPACSSYDQFLNYEERGRFFKKRVKNDF